MRRLTGLAALALLGGCVVYDREDSTRPADPPLARDEALTLVRAGLADTVVFELVDRRGVEPLDADSLAALKKAGASDGLLQKMILAERRPPVVVEEPPVAYYYEGWRPIYPVFGFGFGYSRWHYGRPSRGIRIHR
jgi:hypothetical protein